MNRPAAKGDLVGKTIARVLQTEWEYSEAFSSCSYYLEFTDRTLVWVNFDSIPWVCTGNRESLKDVETDSDYPSCFSSDGSTGVGCIVDNVITTSYGEVYLVLSGQHYLTAEIGEGHTSLYVHDRNDFLQHARVSEFFDYWTKEPRIFDNMRAIASVELLAEVQPGRQAGIGPPLGLRAGQLRLRGHPGKTDLLRQRRKLRSCR
jgi:hypothetical protein